MEKLIITVACDSRTSYPINHYCPPQEDIDGVAQQYIDGIKAGAAIAHIHGIRTLEESMQADGKQVSRIDHDGWKRLQEAILRQDRSGDAVRRRQRAARGEGQADDAPPRHDGGRVQRP